MTTYPFKEIPFQGKLNDGFNTPEQHLKLKATKYARDYPYFIVLGLREVRLEKFLQDEFISTLLHELRHIANASFIIDWFDAALKLKSNNIITDRFFTEYVRAVNGEYQLDSGFRALWEESTAYAVEQEFQVELESKRTGILINNTLEREAIANIAQYGSTGVFAIAKENVSESNVLTIGIEITKTMKDTIQRASKLK